VKLYRLGIIFLALIGGWASAQPPDEEEAMLRAGEGMFAKLFVGDNPYGGARPLLGTVSEQMRAIRNDRLQTDEHRYWATSFLARELWNDGLPEELAIECRSVPPRPGDFSYQSLCILIGPEPLANKIAAVETLAENAHRKLVGQVLPMNVMSTLGDYLTFNGRPVEALRIYKRAFELCPENNKTALVLAKSNLALAYLNPLFPMDVQKMGLKYYDEVLVYHKENEKEAWQNQNLGWTSYNKGIALLFNFRAYEDALASFKAAEGVHLLDIDNAIFQAYTLVHLKRYEEARAILKRTDTKDVIDPKRRQFLSCYKELSYRLMGDTSPIPHCLQLENPQHDVLLDLTAHIMTSRLSADEENAMWRKFYFYFDQKIKPDIQEYLAAATDQAELARMRANEKMRDLELQNLELYKQSTAMATIVALLLLAMALVLYRFWRVQHSNARQTAEEKQHLQGILDGIEEGLITIGPGLIMKPERSSHLDAIVGQRDLASRPLQELLELTDLSAAERGHTAACVEASLGESALTFDLNHPHLPHEWRIQQRTIACFWQPVYRHGVNSGVILVMRDVTEIRERDRQRNSALAASNRILDLSQEIFRAHPKAVQVFLSQLGEQLLELERLMTREGGRTDALRIAHTMKGSARTLGLAKLQEGAHAFESSLVSGTAALPSTELQTLREVASAYQTAMGRLFQGAGHEMNSVWELIGLLKRPLEERMNRAGHAFEGLQLRDATSLDADELKMVYEILLHGLNNAADHGFLLPAARGLSTRAALFEIEVTHQDGWNCLVLRDNGIGIDHDLVMRKAQAQGWQPQPGHDWLDFLFEDGVTTAEQLSATSGRGVGLSAVRAFAARMQGQVQLRNRADRSGAELHVRWPIPLTRRKQDAA
jgi:HPt (histidine-containing phosphotransfer) domain-containing protein/tetratricopeptide (TPR) repeat protein